MATDLDTVYKAMKGVPDPVEVSGEAERFQREAADALAKYFAALLWESAHDDGRGTEGYEVLYNQRAPKAMVLITAAMGTVQDLAKGSNASLDQFLDGVMRGAQA